MSRYYPFLILALVFASFDSSWPNGIYIVPSTTHSCPMAPCLTLEQFAENLTNFIQANTTLLFATGEHRLSKTISVSNTTAFSMISEENMNDRTNIFCSEFTTFIFSDIVSVYIQGLIFNGCNNNEIQTVRNLIIRQSSFIGRDHTSEHESIETTTFSHANGNAIRFLPIDKRISVGGALVVTYSTVEIDTCHFENNTASVGGAIFSEQESMIIINNSNFIFNHASGCDSLHCFGGTLVLDGSGSMFIRNSNFQNNTSEGDGGVAVVLNGTLFMSHSYASNNTATKYGGVIRAQNGAHVSVENCEFNQNSAKAGGAIAAENDTDIIIVHSIFNNNRGGDYGGGALYTITQCRVLISGCTFDNNVADYFGGAATFQFNSVSIIDGSNFTSNTAVYGGALAVTRDSNATANNCQFHYNVAGIHGGAVQAYIQSGITLNNSTFHNNTSPYYGGVAHVFGGSASTINSCTFTNNTAESGGVVAILNGTLVLESSKFYYNRADVDGGTVAAYEKSHVTILHSTFENNVAYHDAGVAIVYSGTTSVIKDCQFTNNSANYGGVLAAIRDNNVTIEDCKLSGNSATTDGATLYGYMLSIFTVNNCSFVDNEAGNDGSIHVAQKSAITISDSGFSYNRAGHDGGGVSVYDNTNLTIIRCRITNSSAGGSGGGLYGRFYTLIVVNNSVIDNCSAQNSGGGVSIQRYSHIKLEAQNYSYFTSNTADYGGFMRVYLDSSASIADVIFSNNEAKLDGGVMAVYKNSRLNIQTSTFKDNVARFGGVFAVYRGTLALTKNNFINNTAHTGGVARLLDMSELTVTRSKFSYNKAGFNGGIVYGDNCNVTMDMSSFDNNMALISGAVVFININGNVTLNNSNFIGNMAGLDGAAMTLYNLTRAVVESCSFINNRALRYGGVFAVQFSEVIILKSVFNFSVADVTGGVLGASHALVSINNSHFYNSKASDSGGALSIGNCELRVFNSTFTNNTVGKYGGAIVMNYQSNGSIERCILTQNRATERNGGAVSLYTEAHVTITDCMFSHNEALQAGGAIAVEILSSVTFATSQILLDKAEATTDKSGTKILSNVAQDRSGGGINLIESSLHFDAQVNISGNEAHIGGGGIFAIDSSITIGSMVFVGNNSALTGGGMGLANTELSDKGDEGMTPNVWFVSNIADSGGALFINDYRDNGTCSSTSNRCFFGAVTEGSLFTFDDNQARESGADLYGGLLDRCTVDDNVKIHTGLELSDGIAHFMEISNTNLDNISSQAVNLCFCKNGQINCSEDSLFLRVRRGDSFTVSVAAVDQVNHPVEAEVQSSIRGIALSAGQSSQNVDAQCSDLEYSIIFPMSASNRHKLTLFANGPCTDEGISTLSVQIEISSCECGPGFIPLDNTIACDCTCDKDKQFANYITECDYETKTVIREGQFWITYLHNDSSQNSSRYLIHPRCLVSYCLDSTEPVAIDLSLPNGSDAQCTDNRGGLLCGSCKTDFSLSLGSSSCLKCPDNWYGYLIGIILAAIIAGPVLVFLLLSLNLTVAIGTLNSIIFYANIINANRDTFFQQTYLVPPLVFISWLNLDIGFDTCFIDKMDTYGSVWINLLFPVYIIVLVVMVICVSSCSSRFAKMIGKRDPVATLATLVLLSYTRLLRTTITSLAFAPLTYPNGTRKVLWFPQPSIGFDTLHNRLKIGSLLLLATVIIVATVLYTFILTFWQCLIRCPRSNLFKWVRNQKIHIFFETYHTPYTQKHRYWTGILLLVRIIVHLVAATTAAVDQFIALLVTVALMCGLQFYKMVTVIRLYKNILIDVMESATFFNIAIFALVTLYTQLIVPGNRNSKGVVYFQVVVAYVSVGVTLALLVGVLTYHVYVHCSANILFKGSDLRAKLTSPAFVRSSRELKQDNVETSENAFLDALDRPRAAYRTPFVHFPTTSVLSPPLRKLSHNWNLTQKESRNLSDSEIAALVTLQKKKASQDRQGQLKNENESELNFDFEGVHDQ